MVIWVLSLLHSLSAQESGGSFMGGKAGHGRNIQSDKGIIRFQGRITSESAAALKDAYHHTGTARTVILDFSGMEHIDVFGLNELIRLHLQAEEDLKELVVRDLSPYFQDVFKAARLGDIFPVTAIADASAGSDHKRAGSPWAEPVSSLKVSAAGQGALNLNVDGFGVQGPVQGFGQLWEKTYQIRLTSITISPREVIEVLKDGFPGFQPPQNRFFVSQAGIAPGEVVLINAKTPAGLISTGVWVLYADDDSFTFMTPQGHPESGWVSFSAFEDKGSTVAQVKGFARASDPLYELGFRIGGSREQEKIWTHVLTSLALHFGMHAWVHMYKTCVGDDIQWDQAGNIRHNAQIRTMIYSIRNMILSTRR